MLRPSRHLGSLLVLLLLFLGAALSRAQLAPAGRALNEGRIGDAISLLHSSIASHPSDPAAHLLLCRAFYAEEMADPAIAECEAAATANPGSSDIQLWLGRALGLKASSANPVLAFSLARRVRDAFERATQLDSRNLAAVSDLGEFYVAAPAIVGGGPGKARSLAATLDATGNPAARTQSHRILARLAEKNGDPSTAEAEFRRAAVAGNSPAAWIDLAAFYARRHQPAPSVLAVHTALTAGKSQGPILVDAASVLTEASREPDLARQLLRDYICSPANATDAAPIFKVHLQLGNLLSAAGDLPGAGREYAAALALAPDYFPARKAASPQSPGRAP